MEQALYKLPDGWEWQIFNDVCTNITDGAHASPKTVENGFPYVTVRDVDHKGHIDVINCKKIAESDFLSLKKGNCLPPVDSVLLSKDGTVGKVAHVTGDYDEFVVLSSLAIIIPDKRFLLPEYLKYFLLSPEFQDYAIGSKTGAAIKRIVLRAIKSFNIPLAPLAEQKRIVEKLDALLSRIDYAIDNLQVNLGSAKSLLASALFGKFHQEINQTPIKNIFNVYNGRAYKQQELLNCGKYKVVRIQNLKGGMNYYYSDLELDDNKYCESGDLLFSWSGTPGSSFGAFIWNDDKAIYHYHIWKMEPKINIDPRYAYWMLRDITEEAIANARGVAGMLHITKGTMESFVVSLPPYDTQQKIAKELDELALKSEQLQVEITSKIDSLKHLRASILDSAFKGEL